VSIAQARPGGTQGTTIESIPVDAPQLFWRKVDLRPNFHVPEGQKQTYPAEHNNVRQIALLLSSDLAELAPGGMFPEH
jgi:hypothetical protein